MRRKLKRGAPKPAYVNAFVDDRTSTLVLLRRDADGQLVVEKRRAEYVTYHKREDVERLDARRPIERDSGLHSARFEGEWYRCAWRSYLDRKLALQEDGVLGSRQVPHFEADLHPVRRWLVDSGVRVQKPRRAFLDIETDSRLSFAQLKAGEGRVLCWTVVAEDGTRLKGVLESDTDFSERVLLEELLRALEGFDQVVAWNGEGFDYLVLKGDRKEGTRGRFQRLGIRSELRRWLWIDHLAAYKKMNAQVAKSGDEKQSFALQAIAQAELKEGKDDFDARKCWEAWCLAEPVEKCPGCGKRHDHSPRECLLRYNGQDTDLLRRIEEKTGFLALIDTICDACGVFPDGRGVMTSNQIDPFMLRFAMARGKHLPTREAVDGEEYEGAYVMEPKVEGVLRNVQVCDFKSLYPSMIVTWNMSPEMLVPGSRGSTGPIQPGRCRAPITGVEFYTDRGRGILAEVVSEFMRLRAHHESEKNKYPPGTPEWQEENRKSSAYKVCANGSYGFVGNTGCRVYNRDVVESVTQSGAYLIQKTRDHLTTHGVHVVYCHTDSSFAIGTTRDRFAQIVKDDLNGELYPRIAREQNCDPANYLIKLEHEKEFSILVMTGTNRYVGRYAYYKGREAVPDGEPEIKGVEYKKGNSPKLARAFQESIIRMLLGDWTGRCPDCGGVASFDKERSKKDGPRIFACASCSGLCEQDRVRFAPPVEARGMDPGDYRAAVERARDFVLKGKLRREHVTTATTLKREVGEYAQRQKSDGSDAAQPPHVQVAKVLLARGEDAGEGTKVAYVVVDGSDGIKAIPAGDYVPGVTEIDRHYLWEKVTWPPSMRLLAAAYPEVPWDRLFGRTRPGKERPPKRGGAAPGQSALDFGASPEGADASVPEMPSRAFVVRLTEASGKKRMRAVREVLERHPGSTPVDVEVRLADGAVVTMRADRTVRLSRALREEVAEVLKGA